MNSQPDKSFLDTLLSPLTREQFLQECWPENSYVTHGPLSRLGLGSILPHFQDVPTLLTALEKRNNPKVRIRLWFQTDGSNVLQQVSSTPSEAKKLYALNHFTLVIDEIHHAFPEINHMLEKISAEVGTPMPSVSCNVYASPKGRGSKIHFDQQENFLVQLTGQKQWTYAPNSLVRFPTQFYCDGPPHEELKPFMSEFSPVMPEDAKQTVLKPGSVLFLPRGTWHASHTIEDSIALTLTFLSAIWADLLTQYLRQQLLLSELWRWPATMLSESSNERPGVDDVVKDLQKRINSEEFLNKFKSKISGEIVTHLSRFKKNPDANICIEEQASEQGRGYILSVKANGNVSQIKINSKYVNIFKWVNEQNKPFKALDVAHVAKDVPDHLNVVKGILHILNEYNVLEKC